MPIKTKKRLHCGGEKTCKTSSKLSGSQMTRYTRDALRRALEDNKFLKAKSAADQNDFTSTIIDNIMRRGTKGITTKTPPYIKASIDCMKCLNNSKLHQLIYDNLSVTYKQKKDYVPASEGEIKVRVKAVVNFLNFVLVPSLKEYKTDTTKESKTEEMIKSEFEKMMGGGDYSIEGGKFEESKEAVEALTGEIISNKDSIEAYYESQMNKQVDNSSCNPNDEEDKERCSDQGKNPEFFMYLITGLFAFALVFEFTG